MPFNACLFNANINVVEAVEIISGATVVICSFFVSALAGVLYLRYPFVVYLTLARLRRSCRAFDIVFILSAFVSVYTLYLWLYFLVAGPQGAWPSHGELGCAPVHAFDSAGSVGSGYFMRVERGRVPFTTPPRSHAGALSDGSASVSLGSVNLGAAEHRHGRHVLGHHASTRATTLVPPADFLAAAARFDPLSQDGEGRPRGLCAAALPRGYLARVFHERPLFGLGVAVGTGNLTAPHTPHAVTSDALAALAPSPSAAEAVASVRGGWPVSPCEWLWAYGRAPSAALTAAGDPRSIADPTFALGVHTGHGDAAAAGADGRFTALAAAGVGMSAWLVRKAVGERSDFSNAYANAAYGAGLAVAHQYGLTLARDARGSPYVEPVVAKCRTASIHVYFPLGLDGVMSLNSCASIHPSLGRYVVAGRAADGTTTERILTGPDVLTVTEGDFLFTGYSADRTTTADRLRGLRNVSHSGRAAGHDAGEGGHAERDADAPVASTEPAPRWVVRPAGCQWPMPLPVAARLLLDLARGLADVHDLSRMRHGVSGTIVHADITLRQFRLSAPLTVGGRVIISDFNRGRRRGNGGQCEPMAQGAGRSPEEHRRDVFWEAADVYSLGHVMADVLGGGRVGSGSQQLAESPEDDVTRYEAHDAARFPPSHPFVDLPASHPRASHFTTVESAGGVRRVLPPGVHFELRRVVDAMLHHEPHRRPIARDVANRLAKLCAVHPLEGAPPIDV
eukprot:TRINITY_DN10024_c0_g1_i1.p1 TRINITY_DN10024_c0_g1~~TRINITY_DN10024_c0_g1_i1.p1  ORF type:complete len:735 (+),score=116.19 TRINITY_DN10024_c0_g1_i1:185-2389(+)